MQIDRVLVGVVVEMAGVVVMEVVDVFLADVVVDGFHFYDINDDGFKWLGEWVNANESFSFPTWKIDCKKRKNVQ